MRRRLFKRDPEGFGKRLNQVLDARADSRPLGDGRNVWLAELFGVKPSSTFAWIHGRSLPEPDRRPIVARELGVSADWLFYGIGNMNDAASPMPLEPVSESPLASQSVRIESVKSAGQAIGEVWGEAVWRLFPTAQQVDILTTIAKWFDAGLSWDNVLQFARHTFPAPDGGNDGRKGGSGTHQANAR